MGRPSKEVTRTEIPEWERRAAQEAQAMTAGAARLGYIPYYGPEIAPLSQAEQAYAQQTQDLASAFGMYTPPSMPSGTMGGQPMSSGDVLDLAISNLQARRPEQYQALQGLLPSMLPGSTAQAAPMGAMSDRERGLMGQMTPRRAPRKLGYY